MTQQNTLVSFDDEPLVLVDDADQEVGHATKQQCHEREGILHRAFSVFLVNADGELLLQQRSEHKRLWPNYWSNACCSHPRRGESLQEAVERRLYEELQATSTVSFLFKFRYQARFLDLGSEHELCHVFAGRLQGDMRPNINEIAAVRWLSADELDAELCHRADMYTPWLKLEWQRIRADQSLTLATGR